jgi:hypothetical protein
VSATDAGGDTGAAGDDGSASGASGDRARLLAGVVGGVIDLVARARTPLAAEQVVCDLLGMIAMGARPGTGAAEPAATMDILLEQVIGSAQSHGTSGALALLRTCAVLGPRSSRGAAAAAAGQLAGAGVRDRVWANDIGHPRGVRAWWYADRAGRQESVGVLFEYGAREHAVTVLIDHVAGGGIKDCWVSEGREARDLRHQTEALVLREASHEFADIDLGEAADLLAAAVAAPPCPDRPEQVECVAVYLELVRSRAEQLTEDTRATGRRRRGARSGR